MSKGLAAAAAVGVAAMVGGAFFVTSIMAPADRFEACRTTTVAGGAAAIGGPFELVDASGTTVTDADVITSPSLLYFGYTFCPDVCPLDVARNAEAVDLLAEEGLDLTPVFISIDPDRDTPEVVGDFAANMHPEMIGLTGSHDQIAAASKAYKTYYRKREGDPDYYLVDHSTSSYLVFPEEGFIQFFDRSLRPDQMAGQIACFLEAA